MPAVEDLRLFALLSTPTVALQYRRGVAASCRWGSGATTESVLAQSLCSGIAPPGDPFVPYDGGTNLNPPYIATVINDLGNYSLSFNACQCEDSAGLMCELLAYHGVNGAQIYYFWWGTANYVYLVPVAD